MFGYLSFDFGSFRVFLALFCAIFGLFTPKVEVSGKEGKIPLSCSELFLTKRSFVVGFSWLTVYYLYYLTGGCVVLACVSLLFFRRFRSCEWISSCCVDINVGLVKTGSSRIWIFPLFRAVICAI